MKDKIKLIQEKLSLVQQAYIQRSQRAVIVLEGVDAAGKGGLVRRLSWAMDPRALKVWPIGAPSELEKKHHYLQRFWEKMPANGEIAVFDRSWYGRVLVERVEGFAPKADWQRAYEEINQFEHSLVGNGCRVIKLLLRISKDEQKERLIERLQDPAKRWKLSYEDFRNRERWDEYSKAYEDMFRKTSTKFAPWYLVESDDKDEARTEALGLIQKQLSAGMPLEPVPISKELMKLVKRL